ncbi:MAG: GHKL domain-containing protein, partial [Calditrichaeota bacterium]|nr:GHKL domain-containing protein [Calditrichota bacterium]
SGINRILDGTVFNGVTYVVSNTYGLGLVKATKIEWKKADKAFGYTSVIGFQNRLLVSHQSGLLYEFRNNQFTRIRIDTNNIRKMITIDDDLYLLGKDGVAVWNGKDYRLISNPNSNYANCFSIVKLNNTLLMGCIGGLYKLEDEQIKPALLDGFIFDVPIYSILNSGDGIWLGSNKGVYVIKDKQLRHYYNRHGFVGNEVNRSGMILNSNGSVMIGTDRGLSIYHKEYDLFDKPVPRTQLLSLTNENGVIFDPNKTNELAYNNRNLTFNYRAISLYDEEIINYRIRLAGFDANWKVILNAKQNSITYTNLPYGGPYTFMIQARSDDGEWSNELSSQPFYIRYPFYLTWWFMALLVLLIALIGYWINSYLNHARNNRYLQQRIDEKMSEIAAFNDQIIHQNTLLKREITDREKAEAEREQFVKELKEKNKELERYTYTVSHDLKSPLITIKGYIGLLKDYAKLGDIEKMTENVSTISSAADTMYQLLDDLVSITKIEKIESQFSEFNMIDVVNHVIDTLGPRLAEKKIKVEIADRMPVIFADKSRMVEVVKNLVDNAIKYSKTHKKNRIRINYQIDGEKHRFSVADNGIGIDMQYKDKIFGIFERLNLSIDGTGIGLAIVKSIIERHNGRVWVESDGPDKGSTFYFTLPLH